jgi:hypothetical protein
MDMKKLVMICVVLGFLFAVCPTVSNASIITSPSDPALSGATVIDFEAQTLGSYTSLVIGDVTFTANDNHLMIDNAFNGQYNTQGIYLDNGTYENIGFSSMTINFGNEVTAFGFNWGASDYSWVLTAYDASNNPLETYNLPITGPSNSGDFVGLAANGIDYAVLSTSGSYDWIMIDNFTFKPIPAPGAILLGSIGVGLVSWLRRRRTL